MDEWFWKKWVINTTYHETRKLDYCHDLIICWRWWKMYWSVSVPSSLTTCLSCHLHLVQPACGEECVLIFNREIFKGFPAPTAPVVPTPLVCVHVYRCWVGRKVTDCDGTSAHVHITYVCMTLYVCVVKPCVHNAVLVPLHMYTQCGCLSHERHVIVWSHSQCGVIQLEVSDLTSEWNMYLDSFTISFTSPQPRISAVPDDLCVDWTS